ncbi:hypothetical protein V8D89_006269 [Ganoderma adspersum]
MNVRAAVDNDPVEAVMDISPGVRLGGAEVQHPGELMASAVRLAEEVDAVIAIVGLNRDWETEGYDRTTLALPGRMDELVHKVAAANKRTIAVTQSGSSITMPWADEVSAMYTRDAIGQVLTGEINPCGRLSLSFPKRLEDVASHGHFHHEHGKVWYAEDLFVGYKHHHHRGIEPQWHFGHGLSYTTFEYPDLSVSEPTFEAVRGWRPYVSHPSISEVTHPPLALNAFAKVFDLLPGKSENVTLALDKHAVSFWEERISRWVVEEGVYGLRVGRSSALEALALKADFTIARRFEWNGL